MEDVFESRFHPDPLVHTHTHTSNGVCYLLLLIMVVVSSFSWSFSGQSNNAWRYATPLSTKSLASWRLRFRALL